MKNTIVTNNGYKHFRPLHDRILVKRIPTPGSSLILLTDEGKSHRAEIVSVGAKVTGLKPGDLVLLPGVAATYPDWEKSDYMLVREADVGGVYSK